MSSRFRKIMAEESIMNIDTLLQRCGVHYQTYTQGELRVHSPIDGSEIARVGVTSSDQASALINEAHHTFLKWRSIPAPRRGELIRLFGETLRQHKSDLGNIISIEVGKIVSEGAGEVQEMIDICDFAVGLSRQLHGLTIASERPDHRMMECWHPLGPVGIVTAFNFPVAVWSWNAALAAVCGDVCLWKPSPLTPLCSVAVQALCDRVAAAHRAAGVFSLAPGGADAGGWMCDNARLPLISFTGSIAVGRQVASRVASRL